MNHPSLSEKTGYDMYYDHPYGIQFTHIIQPSSPSGSKMVQVSSTIPKGKASCGNFCRSTARRPESWRGEGIRSEIRSRMWSGLDTSRYQVRTFRTVRECWKKTVSKIQNTETDPFTTLRRKTSENIAPPSPCGY